MHDEDSRVRYSHRVPELCRPNPFMEAAESRRAADPEFVDLSVTNPTRVGLGLEAPVSLMLGHEYDPDPHGLVAARSAVAAYYGASGASVASEDIVLTASTSEAYAFLFKLLADPGDEVLVPEPSYPLFEHLTLLEGVAPRSYPLVYSGGRWCVDLDALAERISPRSRALVLVHPNNPTGSYLHKDEIESLGRVAAKHRLPLIVDEVFFEYPSTELGFTPVRPADRCPEPLIFSLGGLSKLCGMPQAKLAWIRVSGSQSLKRSALEKLAFITDAYLSVSTAVQDALPAFLANAKTAQSKIRARLEANSAHLSGRLRDVQGFRVRSREGGWYAVVELPPPWTDESFTAALLESSVFAHPGYFYDFAEENLIVLSLLAEEATWRRGLDRMVRLASGVA